MKLLREPLLHFAVAGALLFAAYAWLNPGEDGAGTERTVRITEREVNWLIETSTRQRQRAPNQEELHGLVSEYLREELLAREARELELDRDDTIVRRRLAQKMSFMVEDTARLAEPTPTELRELYETDRERFAEPARTSFEQIYFNREKRGEQTTDDAKAALALLVRHEADDRRAASSEVGDGSLLPAELESADPLTISGQFGDEFAQALAALAPLAQGTWQGPIESSFGLHLVRVTARLPPVSRPFGSVQEELVVEWRRRREESAKAAYFASLLQKYDVQVSDSVRPLLGSAVAALQGRKD